MKTGLIKLSKLPFGSIIKAGGIASAQLLSKPYIDQYGDTVVDVLWDNDPFMKITSDLASCFLEVISIEISTEMEKALRDYYFACGYR